MKLFVIDKKISHILACLRLNTFKTLSATRSDSRHQNKVKVKGLGRNSSYLGGFSIFFLWF